MPSYLKMETVQEKVICYFGFAKRSPLSKCDVVTEVDMEKIHFQVRLPDAG
jgi:hypothetical protein